MQLVGNQISLLLSAMCLKQCCHNLSALIYIILQPEEFFSFLVETFGLIGMFSLLCTQAWISLIIFHSSWKPSDLALVNSMWILVRLDFIILHTRLHHYKLSFLSFVGTLASMTLSFFWKFHHAHLLFWETQLSIYMAKKLVSPGLAVLNRFLLNLTLITETLFLFYITLKKSSYCRKLRVTRCM